MTKYFCESFANFFRKIQILLKNLTIWKLWNFFRVFCLNFASNFNKIKLNFHIYYKLIYKTLFQSLFLNFVPLKPLIQTGNIIHHFLIANIQIFIQNLFVKVDSFEFSDFSLTFFESFFNLFICLSCSIFKNLKKLRWIMKTFSSFYL